MAFIIDTINGSGLYAQSAASASVATHDSNGNVITATYLTAHQPISADEWNNVYDTVNVYSGSWTGSESSPTASVDSNGSIDIVSSNNTVYFDVNGTWFNDAVNSAVDVPTGVMVESACEYNAVNEISGYNGSAIAQYGAEKQWLQHDDTIVHVANSAQYAFGCNVSALQRLMGIDETVLWEGTRTSAVTLSEPASSFNKISIFNTMGSIITVSSDRYYVGFCNNISNDSNCYWCVGRFIVNGTSLIVDKSKAINIGGWTSTNTALTITNNWDYGKNIITKVVGIGRKS